MTNETGIERVFYIYNSSGCSCLWPYFHPPLLYTELCEVLWVPKLHRFPNKAGLCPGGTSWGLFHSSIGRTQRERPWALWFWQLILKLVLEATSGQWHAELAPGWGSMLCLQHKPSGIPTRSPQWLQRCTEQLPGHLQHRHTTGTNKSHPDRLTGLLKSQGGKTLKFYPKLPQEHGVFIDTSPLQTSSGWQRKRLYQGTKYSKIRKKLDYIQMRVGWHSLSIWMPKTHAVISHLLNKKISLVQKSQREIWGFVIAAVPQNWCIFNSYQAPVGCKAFLKFTAPTYAQYK